MVLRFERSSLHVRYDLDEGSAYTRHVARIENICVHSPDHNKMEKIVGAGSTINPSKSYKCNCPQNWCESLSHENVWEDLSFGWTMITPGPSGPGQASVCLLNGSEFIIALDKHLTDQTPSEKCWDMYQLWLIEMEHPPPPPPTLSIRPARLPPCLPSLETKHKTFYKTDVTVL